MEPQNLCRRCRRALEPPVGNVQNKLLSREQKRTVPSSGVAGAAEFASPHPMVSQPGAGRALMLGADQAFRIRECSNSRYSTEREVVVRRNSNVSRNGETTMRTETSQETQTQGISVADSVSQARARTLGEKATRTNRFENPINAMVCRTGDTTERWQLARLMSVANSRDWQSFR